MTVIPSNLVQGPADLWYAQYGTTGPADSAVGSPPGSGWITAGGTQGGITTEVDNTYTDQKVDQIPDAVGARLTGRTIQVTTQLAEATLANLNMATNYLLSLSVQSGYTTGDLQTTTSATQPTYTTIIVDGWAPTTGTSEIACRRRAIIWKALAQAKITLAYEVEKNAVYNVTWKAYYVSPSISPVHWVDQTT